MPIDPKDIVEDDFADFSLRGPDPAAVAARSAASAPMALPPAEPADARPRASTGSSAAATSPCPKCASINVSSSFCSGAEMLMHRHPAPTRHYQCQKCRHRWDLSSPVTPHHRR